MYRNILWGLIKACEDAGKTKTDAVAMMKNHRQIGWHRTSCIFWGSQINAGSFWYFAKENGFVIPKVIKTYNPENPKEEVTITIDKMQKVDANELLAELESIQKKVQRI